MRSSIERLLRTLLIFSFDGLGKGSGPSLVSPPLSRLLGVPTRPSRERDVGHAHRSDRASAMRLKVLGNRDGISALPLSLGYNGRTTRVLGPLSLNGDPATGLMGVGVIMKTYSLLVTRLVA
jgi:hypothetical protein